MIDLLEAPGLGLDIDAEGAKKYLRGRGRRLLRLKPAARWIALSDASEVTLIAGFFCLKLSRYRLAHRLLKARFSRMKAALLPHNPHFEHN